MDLGLVDLIVAAAEDGIDGQPQCQQEKQDCQSDGDDFSALVSDRISSFRTGTPECFSGVPDTYRPFFFLTVRTMTPAAVDIRRMPTRLYIQVP